jgi:hypothetical protein
MPMTSDTITAPPQLSRLVSSAALKSTLVIWVPLSDTTVAKFDHVGLNWKYVVVCSWAFLSARITIHAIGNSEKTNQMTSPTSAVTELGERRLCPGSSSLRVGLNLLSAMIFRTPLPQHGAAPCRAR